jgi:hypothetical protein
MLVIPQLVRFMVAVFAKRKALNMSTMPFFDGLLDCMDSRGRVKSPRKVHVAPVNQLHSEFLGGKNKSPSVSKNTRVSHRNNDMEVHFFAQYLQV